MSGSSAIIFGNQLYANHPALDGADRVLMVESARKLEKRYLHAKKIVFVVSAMRHYRDTLRERGIEVDYREAPTFSAGLADHLRAYQPERVIVVEPAEYPAQQAIEQWPLGTATLTILTDTVGFTCDRKTFASWAKPQKALRLERFYRWQRERLTLLMNGKDPVTDRWNFDAENREPARKMPPAPSLPTILPDAITQTLIDTVQHDYPQAWGSTERFGYPVTHADAQRWLDAFITDRLPQFGPWEDAIRDGDPFLFHGVIALLLNIGLLTPSDVAHRAEAAYRAGSAPIQSVEGFIRQIIGWREYVHGVYWQHMPDYAARNFFEHDAPLPDFFWSGETDMRCLHQIIGDVQHNAYSHHIQRLMIVSNFGNLAGITPAALTEWFLNVYIDAYDWVMWPNVLGLGLFADGGLMSTKPYIASAAYIRKMSVGYCDQCRYDATARTGADACPFNVLYWDFLARHRDKLAGNVRMMLAYKGLDQRTDIDEIQTRARDFRETWSKDLG